MLRSLTVDEISGLVDRYFTPYADAFADLVDERLAAVGEVTIIDQHSYPLEPMPYELHADGPRPEVCIGTDPFHTPPSLADTAAACYSPHTPTGDVGFDSPFAGCYVPLRHYGIDANVSAVMIELRRDLYLDESFSTIASGHAGFWQSPRRPHRPDRARPMSIPIWFLDIDGVVNALARPAPIGYQITTANTMGRGWRIAYSREVVDFINRVNREGLAEVRWLTTWEQDAHRELAPTVGLDAFPAYDIP